MEPTAIPAEPAAASPEVRPASPGGTPEGAENRTTPQKPETPAGAKTTHPDPAGDPPASEKPAYRSLETLQRLASGSMKVRLSKEEALRVRTAAAHSLQSDAEIDQKLAEAKKPGATPAAAPAPSPKPKGTPPTATPPAPPQKADTPAPEDDLSEVFRILHTDVKDKKSVAEALRFVKTRSDELGAVDNEYKALGATGARDGLEAIKTLNGIDTFVSGSLDTVEGLKALYGSFGKPLPSFLGGVVSPAAPAKPPSPAQAGGGGPAAPGTGGYTLEQIMAMPEEELVEGRHLRALPGLIQSEVARHVQEALKGAVDPLNQKFSRLGETLQPFVHEQELKSAANALFADARHLNEHAAEFGLFEKLASPPEKVWAESFDAQGNLLAEPHPEWPRLKTIIDLRAEAAKAGLPLMPYVGQKLLTTGALQKLRQSAQGAGAQKVLASQARVLQPSLAKTPPAPGQDDGPVPQGGPAWAKLKREDPERYWRLKGKIAVGGLQAA